MSRWGTWILLAVLVAPAAEAQSIKKARPLPQDFGRVVLDRPGATLPTVVFDHWLHRAKFTCRVCHVDIGFAMKGGATQIQPADNARGYYCGACHNGRMTSGGNKVFEACVTPTPRERRETCLRCHSGGKESARKYDFQTFTRGLPRGRFGNGIDWEKAEQDKLVNPVDFVEGASIQRASIAAQKDFALAPTTEGMPGIVFSHVKHTRWNGCELCHPQIFVGVKKGAESYSMVQIFEGQYCGACHVSVAFPLIDCQRCHTKPVQ
jgi:c(7)-type cytochrome triheme protein